VSLTASIPSPTPMQRNQARKDKTLGAGQKATLPRKTAADLIYVVAPIRPSHPSDDVLVHEFAVELAAHHVVDESFLCLGRALGLVLENDIVIPPALD